MHLRVVRGLLLATGVAGLLVPAAAAAPAVAVDVDCEQITDQGQRPLVSTDADSAPLVQMRVPEAQHLFEAHGLLAGHGVRVAVVDSGVFPSTGLSIVERVSFGTAPELSEAHGTEVAGLIAGASRGPGKPIGVAPGADIVDVQVYDSDVPADGETRLTTPGLVKGLEWVADNADRLGIGVVNVSHAVPPSEDLKKLKKVVNRLWKQDVIVVAAAGNRPTSNGDPFYTYFGYAGQSERPPGEDAVNVVFPAGYKKQVVAVSASIYNPTVDDDLAEFVLQNSAIDVAAPTVGAVTIGINGSTCLLYDTATSWSTAEVSGILALLRSAYPDDNAAQVVARLKSTANGTTEIPTVLTGAGVVQPLEALTRPLNPDAQGHLDATVVEGDGNVRATPPEPDADPLAGTRHNAVWWGLLGGGALLLAVVLRPVLARRRPVSAQD